MNFIEVLRTAIFALRGNWMRSALTSLGVIIGIAAVIVMVSVGQGTQARDRQAGVGPGLQPARHQRAAAASAAAACASAAGSRFTLTDDDADAIRERDPGSAVRRRRRCAAARQLVYAENNWSTQLAGRAAGLVRHQRLDARQRRRASTPRDYSGAAKAVILGETVRRELFGDEDPLGQTRAHRPRAVHRGRHAASRRARAASARTRTTSWWCRWKPRAAA